MVALSTIRRFRVHLISTSVLVLALATVAFVLAVSGSHSESRRRAIEARYEAHLHDCVAGGRLLVDCSAETYGSCIGDKAWKGDLDSASAYCDLPDMAGPSG